MKSFLIVCMSFCFVILSLNSQEQTSVVNFEKFQEIAQEQSIELYPCGNESGFPMINMQKNEKLVLSFDHLGDNAHYYYRIFHCDANWQKSDLITSEFMDGFERNELDDGSASFNTLVSYWHYQLILPNDLIRFKYSGNYLIEVFKDDNDNQPVFARRFLLLNSKVSVKGQVRQNTMGEQIEGGQRIIFTLNANQLHWVSPAEQIKVVILQNDRWQTAIQNINPRFIGQSYLDYDQFNLENVFAGNNEFRHVDFHSLRSRGEHVKAIAAGNRCFHVFVDQDEQRKRKGYFFRKDNNGAFYILGEDRFSDVNTECDYCEVHFSLKPHSKYVGSSVYIIGRFNDYRLTEMNRMVWNSRRSCYEGDILLKQGAYDYCYALKTNEFPQGITEPIEGSYRQTENEYRILVYFQDLDGRYDQLVGMSVFNSAGN